MPLWSNTGNTSGLGAPKWKNLIVTGNGAATGANAYANTTPGAFHVNAVVGVFAMDVANVQAHPRETHAGWGLYTHLEGGVSSVLVNNVGANVANGETIILSGGSVNATLTVVTNATGNATSLTVTTPGLFPNASVITQAAQRQTHVANLFVTGSTGAFNNADYIVASNGTVNAVANISTNSSGGITNASFTITTIGLFGNAATNASVVVNAYASNGAVSNGTGATFGANLISSTGLSANLVSATGIVLGGNAGRRRYEVLVAMGSIAGDVSNPPPADS